jgi:hypothetical protein
LVAGTTVRARTTEPSPSWSTLHGLIYSASLMFILEIQVPLLTILVPKFVWIRLCRVDEILNSTTYGLHMINSWRWSLLISSLQYMALLCTFCVLGLNSWKGIWKSSTVFILVIYQNEYCGLNLSWSIINLYCGKTWIINSY